MNTDVRGVKEDLAVLLRDLDPDAIPLCEVPGQWKEYVAIAQLATSAVTLLARRVEEGDTWRKSGFRSAADQLALLSGTSISQAKAQIKTSKRVKRLPKTANAMRKGKLSPAKAEAIADAANVDPDAEDKLLDDAEKKPLAELRKACLNAKGKDRDKAHDRIHRERCGADVFTDAEGAWNVRARGTADSGAGFMSTWQPLIDAEFKKARAEGRDEPMAAYAYDALMQLAELASATPHAENAPANDPEPTKKPKRTAPRHLAMIRVDYETLVRGAVEGEETCEIVGLGPIPVRIARELLGDAILKLVITKGIDVMNVTHLGRSFTVAQQVALWWLSPECDREGCTRTQHLENDHRRDWAKNKQSRLDNADHLCGHDHRLKTDHGWALVAGKGKRPMVPPDDPRHPKYRPPQRK